MLKLKKEDAVLVLIDSQKRKAKLPTKACNFADLHLL